MGNSIKDMVLETVEGLYKTGTVDEITLREVRALCLRIFLITYQACR